MAVQVVQSMLAGNTIYFIHIYFYRICNTTNIPTTCRKCGNGKIEVGEECDDGNVASSNLLVPTIILIFVDDGCSSTCAKEALW